MFRQTTKQLTQKRFISIESLPKLEVQNKYKSKGSAYKLKPQPIKPGVYYQPSPSIPSPLQKTPNAFLPKTDIRKSETSQYTESDIQYMPELSKRYEKKYDLTSEQVKEIQELRAQDPYKNTVNSLAKKYGCSKLFVQMVVDCPEDRLLDMEQRLETIKSMWSKRKLAGKKDHEKRVQNWYKNA